MRIRGTITLLFHGELSTFHSIACHLRLLPSPRNEMVRCVSRSEASQDDTRRRLATPFKGVSAKAPILEYGQKCSKKDFLPLVEETRSREINPQSHRQLILVCGQIVLLRSLEVKL